MGKLQKINTEERLIKDITRLINESKQQVAQNINAALTLLYWKIGKRIRIDLLQNKRAEYGKQIVATVSRQLIKQYGNGFAEKSIRRMIQFAEVFPDEQNVAITSRQLSWSHFVELIPLKQTMQRDFYSEMCRLEKWSVITLRTKINSMLYERTAISKKPKHLIKKEIKELKEGDKLTPDLVFRDPYLLDFLGFHFLECSHTDHYEIACDVCGEKKNARLPGGGYTPWCFPLGFEAGMSIIKFGKTLRKLFVCNHHKDSEVKAKIKKLI